MSGSRKAPPKKPWGIILGQTDGVDLTTRLMAEQKAGGIDAQIQFLSRFFSAQISTFGTFAALDTSSDRYWKIVETTGDGLILAVHVDEEDSKDLVFSLYLQALIEIRQKFQNDGIHIRSVSHFCKPREVIYGGQLNFGSMLPQDAVSYLEFNPDLLGDELFGQDRIKLARLMSVAKGPFGILTEAFINGITGLTYDPKDPDNKLAQVIGDINTGLAVQQIDPDPIPLPIMRGFTEVHLDKPYLLWELKTT